jgi:hypothetical protein
MYANVCVTLEPKPRRRTATGAWQSETLYVWHVESRPKSRLALYLDANDGNGRYAEPDGVRDIDLKHNHIQIGADF